MKAYKTTTKDGRVAYKTAGGSKTQAVYQRERGQYVKGPDDKPIVIGYRVIRYGWVNANGKAVKTTPVSVLVSKHPSEMSPAETRTLDRELSELLRHSQAVTETVKDATRTIAEHKGSIGVLQSQEYADIRDLIENNYPKDSGTKGAISEFVTALQQHVANVKATSDNLAVEVEQQTQHIEGAEINLEKMGRYCSLGNACFQYLMDTDHVHAGNDTRRIYASYLRNHVLVPTANGRSAIGDLLIPEITKDVLTSFERSLYSARIGYRLQYSMQDAAGIEAYAAWLEVGQRAPMKEKNQVALDPTTVDKMIDWLGSVVERAMSEPKEWGLHDYNINTVAKYRMTKTSPQTRKTYAPRGSDFWNVVKAAEDLNLQYMIPLMALTRCTFRPSESRGVRWSDFIKIDDRGKERHAIVLHGTIKCVKGVGEMWMPEGKSNAALGDPVVIPESIMELLEKYRVEGCDYVCAAAPVDASKKNADRRKQPFLTKNDYPDGWKLIRNHIGLPDDCEMYTLKHGLIGELILEGHSTNAILGMTRHTTEQMIKRVYSAISSGDLADAIDVMHGKEKHDVDPETTM